MRIGGSNPYNMNQLQNNMAQMASGKRINRAADDAAGMAIAQKMTASARGEDAAGRNIRDGRSLLQTADGGLDQSQQVLQRMRELAVRANNGIMTESDRNALHQEFDGMRETLSSIARDTGFNTRELLSGSEEGIRITTGSGVEAATILPADVRPESLGRDENTERTLAQVNLADDPQEALRTIDRAMQEVSSDRGRIGAQDNALERSERTAQSRFVNIESARSRIEGAELSDVSRQLSVNLLSFQAYIYAQRMRQDMMGNNLNALA